MEADEKVYEAPRIEVLGSVAELTQHNNLGRKLDATFTAGTDLSDITTSY
ncbi:MAG: lasso RiPP family leader peptide-containing protein [Egibacteraceae bacterium]